MNKPRKKENKRDLAETRRKILDAAAHEFADKGLAGSRVDSIAKRAGVNKAMIYYAFGGKEELRLAVLESLFDEKTREIESKLDPSNLTPSNLIVMMNDYFDAFQRRDEYARIMLDDIVTGGEALRELRKRRPDLFEFFDKITGLLRDLAKKGVVKNVDPEKSVITMIMLILSLTTMTSCMDLAAPRGTRAHESLSDQEGWKVFLTDLIISTLGLKA